ncbi:hypothetical protein BOTCAL_0441g00060 [Botryotinia calthae]|uniref:Heterokaryon incompatibility domain-containing protein n=1 Tax=Botryotinia calthae TaxID=38488 RepID=A0A4Y8CP35_9HELO|nr:hypothetical protein BOTCAL_0441g00060 [Botryotinia calthae]
MTQRCTYCANLSLSHLIDLAKIDFKGHVFPNQPTTEDLMGPVAWISSLANPDDSPKEKKPIAFYPHHKSLQDLLESAEMGCDLCVVILTCLKKRIPGEDEEKREDESDESEKTEDGVYWTDFSRLRDTDIKISINSSHVYPDATLDGVQMFDTILVHVGNIGDYRSDIKNHGSSKAVATQSLTLVTERDSSIRLEGFQIGRTKTDSDLGSKLNFDITRSWLRECLECHDCHSTNLPQLPTRVIDVTPNQTRIVHSNGITANYIALSHCWGGPIPTSSTSATLPQYQIELPFQLLPANFQDAITITRELGVQYLWIDSLCIIQDSWLDWDHESQKMGTVYRDALVTIYAMSSEASTGGIIPNPERQPVKKPSTTLAFTDDDGIEVTVRVEPADIDVYDEDLHRLAKSSPLSSRGWTFQEAILSPRHIYYGQKQIYWGCTQGFHDLKGMPPGYRFPQEAHLNCLLPILHSTIQDAAIIAPKDRIAELKLIDHEVVPKLKDNPYGEIESAYLIVESLTLPVLRAWQMRHLGKYDYDGYSGIYCFDDPAGISHYEVSEPSENYGWHQAFWKEDKDAGVQIMTSRDDRSRGKQVIDVGEEEWMQEEYIVFLVASTNRDDGDERPFAECLILRKVDGDESEDNDTPNVYERVGTYFVHHEPEWLDSWTMKTVKLI